MRKKNFLGSIVLLIAIAHSAQAQSRNDNIYEANAFEVLRPTMTAVDTYFQSNELGKKRARNSKTDLPLTVGQKSTFADQIGLEVTRALGAVPIDVSNITPFYDVGARPPSLT